VCNIWWLSVKGCGCGERGKFAFSHWLHALPLQHWSHDNDLNDRVEDTDDDDDCNDEIEIGDHLLSGDRQADISGGLRADGREPESETVIALILKLALIQEEREAERERFESERERYEMLGGTRAGNGNDAPNKLDYRDIKAILPTMHDEDVLSFLWHMNV